MPISLVGSTTQDPTAAVTTLSSAMPAGVAAGDLVLFVALTNTITIPAAPSGYTQITTSANSTIGLGVWYKFAANSSEPAPSTTQSVFRATSATIVYRGVDPTTPIDVAAGTSTAGTTAVAVPARTPLTTGAWDIAIGSMLTTAANTTTWGSTNLVLDQPSISNVSGSNNPAFVVGHFAWTSGAFTPIITKSATSTRTIGTHFVLRPASTSTTYTASGSASVTSTATGVAAAVLLAAGAASMVSGASGAADRVPQAYDASGTTDAVSTTAGSAVAQFGASGSSTTTTTASGFATSRLPVTGYAAATTTTAGSATVIGGAQSYPATGFAAIVSTATGSVRARYTVTAVAAVSSAATGSASGLYRVGGASPLASTSTGEALALFGASGSSSVVSDSSGSADPGEPPTEFEGRILAARITAPVAVAELDIADTTSVITAVGSTGRLAIPTATGVLT